MRKYIEQLHTRPAHERRRVAMRAAAGIVVFIFIVWISTLGVRLANDVSKPTASEGDSAGLVAAAAAAGGAISSQWGHVQSALQVVGKVDAQNAAAASSSLNTQAQVAPATVLNAPSDASNVSADGSTGSIDVNQQ